MQPFQGCALTAIPGQALTNRANPGLSDAIPLGFEYGFLQPIKLQFRIPLKNGEEPFSRNPGAARHRHGP